MATKRTLEKTNNKKGAKNKNPGKQFKFYVAVSRLYNFKLKANDKPRFKKLNSSFTNEEMTVKKLAEHIAAGYPITAALTDVPRKNANFLSAQLVGLDFDTEDEQSSLEYLCADEFISEHALLVHTTSSHTAKKPRARVIFLLSEPVTDPNVYRSIVLRLMETFGLTVDAHCKDPARLWYGAKDCDIEVLGNTLDPNIVESMAVDRIKPLAPVNSAVLKRFELPDKIPSGNRNSAMTSYGGQLRRKGLSDDTIWRRMEKANQEKFNPPMSEDELTTIYQSVLKMESGISFEIDLSTHSDDKYTDYWVGRYFAALNHDHARYVPKWDRWIIWTGTHWLVDHADYITELARWTVYQMIDEARELTATNPEEARRLGMYAYRMLSVYKIKIIIEASRTISEMVVMPESLDTDPHLLNVQNGTLNLLTEQLEPHRQENFITRVIEVDYEEKATCSNIDNWLVTVTAGDKDLQKYILMAAGRSLFGGNKERNAFFIHGPTSTGKSTFTALLRKVAGPYFCTFNINLILKGMYEQGANSATPELAKLHGIRMAVGTEMPNGAKLQESVFKDMTGGFDTISARQVYKEPFEFIPQFTLWFYGNEKPSIDANDAAVFRRLRTLPFKVQVSETVEDPDFLDRVLLPELSGFLAKLFASACKLHHEMKNKLPVPDAVNEESKEYIKDMDYVQQFIEAGMVTKVKGSKLKLKELYTYFEWWLKSEHNFKRCPISKRGLSVRIAALLDAEIVRVNSQNTLSNWELSEDLLNQYQEDRAEMMAW